MKTRIIYLILFFILNTTLVKSQIQIAFLDYRKLPTDTMILKTMNQHIRNQNLDSLLISTRINGDKLLRDKNINDYLFLMNQVGANTIGLFRNLRIADSIFDISMQNAIKSTDTLNNEYALLLKFIGTSYFYQYRDQESLEYFLRGYHLLEKMQDTSLLITDFKANIGNGYLNLNQMYDALPYMEAALKESLHFKDGLLYMIVSQGLGHIAFKTDVRHGIDMMLSVERNAKQINMDSIALNKFLANICYMLSGFYGQVNDKEMQLTYDLKAKRYISNTTIPDLYLRMNILRQVLYDAIDAGDEALQESAIIDIEKTIKLYEIKDPILLVPVYYTYYQSFHSRNKKEEAEKYKNIVIEAVGNKPSRERTETYNMLMAYAEEKEEQYKFAMIAIDDLIENFDPWNPKNDSIILNTVDLYEYKKTVIPALTHIANYHRDLGNGNRKEELEKAISIYNTLAKVVLRSSNGVVEEATGLKYSTIYENIINQKLIALWKLLIIDNQEITKKDFIESIALSQSFYLQKQMAFRKRNQSTESDKIWSEYFDLLLKKRQMKMEFDHSQLSSNPMAKSDYEDESMKISIELIKKQIQMGDLDLMYAPQILDYRFDQVQSELKEGEAIINYYVINDSILTTCLITRNKHEIKINQNYQKTKELIAIVSRQLKSGESVLTIENQQLTKILLEGFEDELQKTERLIIIPHKELWKIPFEILTKDRKSMLIESHTIVYQNSINLWLESASKPTPSTIKFVGIAPVFSNKTNEIVMRSTKTEYFAELYNDQRESLDHLPFSKLEVENIAKEFQTKKMATQIYLKNEATETAFKEAINNYEILHIATHGYVSKSNPELTGLFFMENKAGIDDAYLFSDEISNLTPQAHLIVLSSCNSGSGIIEGSEGINSLQRYFILAGVPNVMASLWKVHDKSTMLLMQSFYLYYLEGNDYAESLRKAKREAIKNGAITMDWAGFILIGR